LISIDRTIFFRTASAAHAFRLQKPTEIASSKFLPRFGGQEASNLEKIDPGAIVKVPGGLGNGGELPKRPHLMLILSAATANKRKFAILVTGLQRHRSLGVALAASYGIRPSVEVGPFLF